MSPDIAVFFSIPDHLRKINWGVYITIVVCQANKISNVFKWLLSGKCDSGVPPFNTGVSSEGCPYIERVKV
jgi:hypothetical protein